MKKATGSDILQAILMALLLLILFGGISAIQGCASVRYNDKTGQLSYTRIGSQSLEGVEIKKDGAKTTVKMQRNTGDAGILGEAIIKLTDLAAKGATP